MMYPYLKVTTTEGRQLVRLDLIAGVYEREGGKASIIVSGDRLDIETTEGLDEIARKITDARRSFWEVYGGSMR